MLAERTRPRWLDRMHEIDSEVRAIRFPDAEVSQDREWCEVDVGGHTRRVRLHDYHEIYRIPGLYERLFYKRLRCCSPSRVSRLLASVLREFGEDADGLRVLDVGAGNGMVGDELKALGAARIVGIDIFEEAKQAAYRDRPGVYDDYLVTDLTDIPEEDEKRLRRQRFNCLTTVAALGFGDIPPKAFAKALDMVSVRGWLAFNIKEDFLCERDTPGFCKLIRHLSREKVTQIQAYRRYRHRLSITGKPLYYVAVAAKKLKDVPDDVLEALE